ncbi:MAG: D-alanine-D-alanine ligase [Actinomycetota bacterium]|jgi:D-alanine-D-alanine ligase|nr:D-alanine-D-alanine ligase [Actinomycetota bacterium]
MSYLILAGGLSHERDVSLRSGRRCADALRHAGYDVEIRDADASLLPSLTESSYDAVLIALHGGAGEDGALRQVLELTGVPYVGSTPDACRAAWDKPTAKATAVAAGLSTPESVTLPHATFRELGATNVLDRIVAHLGLPLMVKPARGGSALGCTAVDKPDELPAAMVQCFSYGEAALIEQLVTGTELAVTVLDGPDGPRALPAVEVHPLSGVYDYTARYTAGQTEYFAPARLSSTVAAEVSRVAVAAHAALGLRDLSRVDLIVDASGVVQLLEVNVSPGMTETSLLPMAVEADGLELGVVLGELLERAARR